MFILISDYQNYVPLPWQGETACLNYKREDRLFSTEEFYEFIEGLNGDYSNIKGIVVISPLKDYEFISKCTKINQLFIYDSKTEIEISLSELIYLKQLVIDCKKFKGDSIFNLIDNKIKCFEQDINEDNPKLSKYTLVDMAIKNVNINNNEIDKICKSPIFRGELIINSAHILTEFELSLRDKYIERQRHYEKYKDRKNISHSESIKSLKRLFSDES